MSKLLLIGSIVNKKDPSKLERQAFSLVILAIMIKLEGIMEMVEDHKNGLLIDVKSSDQLFSATMSFDKIDYSLMLRYTLKELDSFNNARQTNLFLRRGGLND